jgi:hypothetical protein
MDFQVNKFTTIKDFERTGVFETFMKHGQPSAYELFTGLLGEDKVQGYICISDSNIYKLTLA